MWIDTGDQPFRVACSHVYDPLDDMLVWLEAIVLDNLPARFVVDEEGSTVAFEAIALPQAAPERLPVYSLVVTHDYVAPTLQFALSKHVLVSAFYKALTAFGDSDAYFPEQWEFQSLEEKFYEVSGLRFLDWIEQAILLERKTLLKTLWDFELNHTDDLKPQSKSSKDTELFKAPKNAANTKKRPRYMPFYMSIILEIYEAYPTLSKADWQEDVDGWASYPISGYGGYSWRQKRSMLVEQWLAGQQQPAEQGA